VGDACRTVVAFDGMGVARLGLDGQAHLLLSMGSLEAPDLREISFPRTEFSETLWPHAEHEFVLIVDARRELDASFKADRYALDAGVQSILRLPLGRGDTRLGSLVLTSLRPGLFSAEHARELALVAEMVTIALCHERLASEAREAATAKERARLLEQRVERLNQELFAVSSHQVLGESPRWREALTLASKVAPTDTTVLITGESGTGKEVVARWLHQASTRKAGPFLALNCAALPDQLLESELFGHERGAFTGAVTARAGKLEEAAGGVLFLDEVGEMSPAVQAKFLRVLQEREYQRLGGTRTLRADVRVVAATNRDLTGAIQNGGFREDLYYRLAVFEISLPPLRERRHDILILVQAFLDQFSRSFGRAAAGLSDDARETLLAYSWPGNVRELRNAIERAAIVCDGGLITSESLPIGIVQQARQRSEAPQPPAPASDGFGLTLDAAERGMILDALSRAGNNKSKAARLLGLTRAQLRSRLEKHRLGGND